MDTQNKRTVISVIVCTYNHSRPLTRTLDSLVSQERAGEGIDYEVIVVDNNSTDNTKDTVMSYMPKFNGKLRYCFEPSQGQAFARNAGIRAAKADIVVFTDDDCIPSRDWLRNIYLEFASDSSVMILTGKTGLLNEGQFPLSTKDGDAREEFSSPHPPWEIGHGNNFSIKRKLFSDIGMFNVAFGPGTFVGCADDTDFIYRALKKGNKIVYAPGVFVYHAHDRVTEPQIDRIVFNYAKGRGAFYAKNIALLDTRVLRMLVYELRGMFHKYFRSTGINGRKTRKRVIRNLKGLAAGSAHMIMHGLLRPSR